MNRLAMQLCGQHNWKGNPKLAIIRAPRPDRGYTDIKHSTARDARLSYRARGILLRLLTNADNFQMTANDLAREGKEGRTAVLTSLKELRLAGYLRTVRTQRPNGQWQTKTYIFDTPQSTEVGFPDFGSSDFGSPNVGSPDSKASNNKDKNQKHLPSPKDYGGEGGVDEDEIRAACEYAAKLRGKPAAWGRGWARNALARARTPAGLDEDDLAAVTAWRHKLAEQEAAKRQADEEAKRTPATRDGFRSALKAMGQLGFLKAET